MRRDGFGLVETLLSLLIMMILLSSIALIAWTPSATYLARQDADKLARWIGNAIARADRWKRNFSLHISVPQGDGAQHYMLLSWTGDSEAHSDEFYAADGLRWVYSGTTKEISYRWQTHTVTPAFVIEVRSSDGSLSGESLTVSVRGLLTRGHADDS